MFLMVERQIEKQKETGVKKEHNSLVKVLGIASKDTDTESKHCYYKLSDSQGGDSTTIMEQEEEQPKEEVMMI
jgi:hypothetical protein